MENQFKKWVELEVEANLLQQEVDKLQKRITDLEAERFADRVALEVDLARWNGQYAAHVGHELEEVADELLSAIEAISNGDDVRGMLYDLHGDLCSLMADFTVCED